MFIGLFFGALLAAMLMTIAIIRSAHLHAHLSMDGDLSGPQKFHATPTPRVGGVPIMVSMMLTASGTWYAGLPEFASLLLASLPVFLAGLTEDLTKRVRPLYRLLFAFGSAAMAIWLLGAALPSLGIPGVDDAMTALPWLALLLTVFAVGGVCHAVNIIDGYNGLMGGVAMAIAAALAYVSSTVGDMALLAISLSLLGAILGFLVWNFPRGMIFAGDAGAYLVGFLLAEVSVLLVVRHPGVVSPWFPMLLMIYPVFETVFSIYRRKKRQAAAGLPDSMHFHQMVYKRLVRWMVGKREAKHLLRRNSLTAPYLWGVALFSVMPATLFWQYEWVLQLCCALFILLYVWLYRRIVQFRAPRWLVLRRAEGDVRPKLVTSSR
ncbi:MraY family glycosyltransferase [Vogesella indigofera]|uniref:MraY family glycosyltransferase n=1 Tax=Vogesella indigofera TaxID=45465 RepID=UPI00234E6605|nr:glycosyltransferase [Vogesella indigofera]MDC7700846.1 glycosyltransferase [Vogesella indigofera]